MLTKGFSLPRTSSRLVAAGLAGRVPEVVLEVRLAQRLPRGEDVHPIRGDAGGHQLDVRLDAHLLDGDVARGEVLGDGELERALVVGVPGGRAELVEHLHRALAEGLLADDDRPVQVLQRAGDDLRGRGAPGVHQHRQRILVVSVVGVGALLLALPLAQRDGGDDGALAEEEVRDLDGLLEEPAGVAAQVEHQALQARRWPRRRWPACCSAACMSRVVLPWKFFSRM